MFRRGIQSKYHVVFKATTEAPMKIPKQIDICRGIVYVRVFWV